MVLRRFIIERDIPRPAASGHKQSAAALYRDEGARHGLNRIARVGFDDLKRLALLGTARRALHRWHCSWQNCRDTRRTAKTPRAKRARRRRCRC